MKQYKALLIGIILTVLPFNSASALVGFGLQLGQGMFSVDETSPKTGNPLIKSVSYTHLTLPTILLV